MAAVSCNLCECFGEEFQLIMVTEVITVTVLTVKERIKENPMLHDKM